MNSDPKSIVDRILLEISSQRIKGPLLKRELPCPDLLEIFMFCTKQRGFYKGN